MAKSRGRPFKPGNKYGRGRPRGSRNKELSAGENLLQQYEPQLVAKCIGMAMEGDIAAMRLCLRHLIPVGDRLVNFRMNKTRTVAEFNRAFSHLTEAVRKGKLAPSEGESVSRILEAGTRILEKTDTALRVESLEHRAVLDDRHEHIEGDGSF